MVQKTAAHEQNPSEIVALRMAAQHIAGRPAGNGPADTLRWMGALQAQDYGQAVWALGLRTGGATLQTVTAAIEAGTIIRTWPMRGTVHFIASEDAGWMLGLGAARMIAADARRLTQLGLDEATLARCGDILSAKLQGRQLLSRSEVMQTLEDNGISTKGGRGYHIIWRLAQAGIICIGPMIGKQQSFALLREWAPDQRKPGREEALAMLAQRYFTSHGPATIQDFAWWSGLTMADCKIGLEATRTNLTCVVSKNNKTLRYSADSTNKLPIAGKTASLQLLPGFDEYFLGYKDRTAFTDPLHMTHIVPGNNGVFKPIIIMDGRVVGTWQRKILKTSVEVLVAPFDKIPGLATIARPAAEAYAKFMGLPLGSLSSIT